LELRELYEILLVPLDGSEEAKVVLPYVQEIATKFGSKIVLVRVFESEKKVEGAFYMDEIAKQMHLQLSKQGSFLPITTEIIFGKPAQAILESAQKNVSKLIIVSSHGLSGHDM
jgi:nucleotide-binding universal stress UspA family protein